MAQIAYKGQTQIRMNASGGNTYSCPSNSSKICAIRDWSGNLEVYIYDGNGNYKESKWFPVSMQHPFPNPNQQYDVLETPDGINFLY